MKVRFYILMAALVTCAFLSSSNALDYTMSVRHIVWGIVTLVLFFTIMCEFIGDPGSVNLGILKRFIFPAFLGYLLISVLSLVKAINIAEGQYEVLKLTVTGVHLFNAAIILPQNKERFVKVVTVLALVLGCYGIYEFFTVKMVFRTGTFSGKNLCSEAFIMMLPACFYCLKFKRRWRVFGMIAGILILFNIATLSTRSVWLALIIALIVTLPLFKIVPVLKTSALIVTFMTVFAIVGCWRYPDFIKYAASSESLSQRWQKWAKTLEMSRDNLFLGVGAGNWRIAVPQYGNYYYLTVGDSEVFYIRPHNEFLGALSEKGVFGLVCYLAIFSTALYYAYKGGHSWIFFAIVSYIVFAFFDFPNERVFHPMILFSMMGLVISSTTFQPAPRVVFAMSCLVMMVLTFATYVFIVRYKTETMVKWVNTARVHKDWRGVIRFIDEGYSRLSQLDNITAIPIMYSRAEANEKLKNRGQAHLDLLRAEKANPNHLYVITALGSSYLMQGNKTEAMTYYKKAIDMCPTFGPAVKNMEYLLRRKQ